MSDVRIERNVPIPGHGGGAPLKYPWDALRKGDSVVVGSAARRAAFLWASRNRVSFTSRAVGEDQFRIWGIA